MPLFSRSSANTSPAVHETTQVDEPRRGGLFKRHHSPDHATTTTTTMNGTNSHRRGLFHRNAEDPSILAARERVFSAEEAEREADKALANAKGAVREAREHVKRLERETAEEARLAKIKQNQAKSISKRASHMGRHDHNHI